MGRIIRRLIGASLLGALLGAAAVMWFYPALAGAACPACFGLRRAAPGIYAEATIPAADRAQLVADVAAAKTGVAAYFGDFSAASRILACQSAACDRALGGRGAKAVTYSLGVYTVIRVAPGGLNRTILTHELAHAEFHRRIGLWRQVSGQVPAWFDEGLAVIVSDDPAYLAPGTGLARCRAHASGPLPESPFDWAPLAARRPNLYAESACAVLGWMATQDGQHGLLAAIASGQSLP